MERDRLGLSPELRTPPTRAGQRTSGWGQAIEHGPGTTLYVIDPASSSRCPLVVCDIASHAALQPQADPERVRGRCCELVQVTRRRRQRSARSSRRRITRGRGDGDCPAEARADGASDRRVGCLLTRGAVSVRSRSRRSEVPALGAPGPRFRARPPASAYWLKADGPRPRCCSPDTATIAAYGHRWRGRNRTAGRRGLTDRASIGGA